MEMAKVLGQLFSWLATDVIVKGLANNKTFQRVAVKVDKFQSTAEKLAEQKSEELAQMAKEGTQNAAKMAQERAATAAAAARRRRRRRRRVVERFC